MAFRSELHRIADQVCNHLADSTGVSDQITQDAGRVLKDQFERPRAERSCRRGGGPSAVDLLGSPEQRRHHRCAVKVTVAGSSG